MSSGSAGDGVSLYAGSITAPGTVMASCPPLGTLFVVVDFTLKNLGAMSISTSDDLFSLRTSLALVLPPSSTQPSSQCNPGSSLATGSQVECKIAFQTSTA